MQEGHISQIMHVTEQVLPLSPPFDPWRRTDSFPETPCPCLNAKRWMKSRKQAFRSVIYQRIISNGFVVNLANGEYRYITTERNCQFLSRGVSLYYSSKQDRTSKKTFMDNVSVNYSLPHLHCIITFCHLSNTDREDLKTYIRA